MPRRRTAEHDDVLRRVFREHVDAVYALFAYNVDAATAEDLTSATFEKVIRAWRRYDPAKASERTWILAIARNTMLDHFRRSAHRTALSTDEHPRLLETVTEDEDFTERRLAADELRSWLSVLGDRDREVLALRYAADLPAADIGRLVGLSTANVHQILSRSLRKLRLHASGEPAPGP
jgi:RNA polymerase sigma-70 factor (ECF subfamily)